MQVVVTQTFANKDRPVIEEFDLTGRESFTLGRLSNCDVVLLDGSSKISKIQATLFIFEGEWYIRDGSDLYGRSTSGVYVDHEILRARAPIHSLKIQEAIIYQGGPGTVIATFEDTDVQDSLEDDTEENDYALSLRKDMRILQARMIEDDQRLETKVKELDTKVDALDKKFESGLSQLQQDIGEIKAVVNEEREKNVGQDRVLRQNARSLRKQKTLYTKILATVSAVLIGGAVYMATGSRDTAMKVLSAVFGTAGVGSGGKVVMDIIKSEDERSDDRVD
jgi:predicted component of type VI protein secretion system